MDASARSAFKCNICLRTYITITVVIIAKPSNLLLSISLISKSSVVTKIASKSKQSQTNSNSSTS